MDVRPVPQQQPHNPVVTVLGTIEKARGSILPSVEANIEGALSSHALLVAERKRIEHKFE